MIKIDFKIPLVCFFLITTVGINSQWITNYYGNSGSDVSLADARGISIVADNNENSYVTGYTTGSGNGKDIILIKYNPAGDTLWTRIFNGTSNSDDDAAALCLDNNGNVYIAGAFNNNNTGNDLSVIKVDSSGEYKWTYTYYAYYSNNDDRAEDIIADASGNIYVTGYCTGSDNINRIISLKLNSSGSAQWIDVENKSAYGGRGKKLAADPAGNIYITGYILSALNGSDIALLKYTSSGNNVFTNTTGGASEDKAWGIAVDDGCNIYITGYMTNSSGNTDLYTVKYDSAGSIQWSRSFNGSGNNQDKAWGIAVDDGAVYITGESTDSFTNVNYVTISYDYSGNTNWISFYDGTGAGPDKTNAIGLIYENGTVYEVVVAGASWGTGSNYDFATVKYDASTGHQNSVSRYSYNSTTFDEAMDLCVCMANGRVYLTGYSELIVEGNRGSSYLTSLMYLPTFKGGITPDIPLSFRLDQNFPNPFNPETSISFTLPADETVKLAVYDVTGRTVDVLVNNFLRAGIYNVKFSNPSLASGVYFYVLTAGSLREVKKMTLIK